MTIRPYQLTAYFYHHIYAFLFQYLSYSYFYLAPYKDISAYFHFTHFSSVQHYFLPS